MRASFYLSFLEYKLNMLELERLCVGSRWFDGVLHVTDHFNSQCIGKFVVIFAFQSSAVNNINITHIDTTMNFNRATLLA
jgi:hypothetical protein